MCEKLLSVIIPAYNTKDDIEECLNSIISQTYTNIEIIIVDDGSTDGTTEICQKYQALDSRIIFYRQENAGVLSARMKGIEISKGEYVTFVDADDYMELNYIETLYDTLSKKNVIIVLPPERSVK